MANAETYPECFLGSVVNPGEYWLVSKLKTHVKEVKMLEEMLSDEMNQNLTIPDPQLLVPQCCIAVENESAKGNWQRGKLVKQLEQNMYKVFLVDYGHFADVGARHLQLIFDKKYLEVEPLAFRLQLYGVVPYIVTDDFKKKVSQRWSSSAKQFVTNVFSQRLLIYVKKVHIVNRIVFGDLYLTDKPNGSSFSLGKLLCKKGYGVHAESYFKRTVMDVNSPIASDNISEKDYFGLSPDVTMKLERVKEWQLSSAQHQKRGHGEGPDIVESPFDEISDSENIIVFNSNSEKSETPIQESVARKNSSAGAEATEADAKISDVNCNASNGGTSILHSPGAKSRDCGNGGTARVDIPCFPRLIENKKEFNMVLEENFNESPSVEDDSSVGIFTWFSDSIVQPVNKLRNLNISLNIVLDLEKEGNFDNLSPIQRWAIPSIQRGHNVVMIGSAKTGKTLSYVIPFLSILQDRMDAKELPVGNGPVAIILCSGSRSCDIIYYICHVLLRNNSDKGKTQAPIRVEAVYGSSREKKSWVHLTNGCELLISTPHCLARLLKHRGITNLERLDYLVLDDVDVIIQEPFLSPLKMILHQSKLSKDCQRVFCGEKWTPELRNLVNTFAKNHAVLMSSYLEAAIYAKLKPHVLLVEKEKKSQITLDATLPHIGARKILIACEYTSEVLHLSEMFKTQGYSPLVAHSEVVVHDIKELEKRWKLATDAPLMICCDDVIHRLPIYDVEMLVHYSLPTKSKTNFGKRFSVLMKSYEKYSSQVGNLEELCVLVLIDDENHYQLPHVVDFVLRVGGKIPEKVGELSREISWRIEANKIDVPICVNLLEFGDCKNMRNCTRRHAFIKDVDSSQISLSGLVKFEVLHVHSVCYLSVRLIEVIDKTGKKTTFENLSGEISDKLRKFYECEENRTFVGAVEVNKLCAVERDDAHGKHFERARIIEFKKFNKLNKVVEVLVKFVDNGQMSRVSVYKLYELSEDLKNYIPQALDVFLCDLLPNDFDGTWNEEAIFSARTLFTKALKENQFWIGRIRLALKNSLHLESVKLCRFLDNVKTHVIDFSARRKLLTQGIASENNKHLEKLRLLCEKANIELPGYQGEEDKLGADRVKPDWAFLDGDLPRVEFISADSTSRFFIRNAKFRNLLTNLEKECQKVGNEMKLSRSTNKGNDKWVPHVGSYCLALYENSWNRGRVESIVNDQFLVFFLDYGDAHYIQDLVPIPTSLLTQLPAQAIECCLVGVNHGTAGSDSVMDEIYSFSSWGTDDLYVSVIEKSENSQMTGGWRYQVNLLNAAGVSLSRKLILADLVKAEEDSFHLAENMDIAVSDSEDEKDVEDNSAGEEVGCIKESCPEGEALKLVDDPSCTMNISDEMFDDESGQLMIEEFAAHIFPWSVTKRKEVDDKMEIPDGKPPTVTAKKFEGSAPRENENEALNSKSKYSEKRERIRYTPQIFWCQDDFQLQIKIILNNAEKYRLTCSTTHFLFRCLLDGKLYVAALRLFGSINPHLTELRVKAFYVKLILKKLCPLQWPRLPRDNTKYRWVKFDVEDFAGEQRSYIESICKKALAEIESGEIKQPRVRGGIKRVPSTDSDDSSESDSDAGDAENFI